MSIVQESEIEFDFSRAVLVVKHDAENRIWEGGDFLIEETGGSIWLEVKNWEQSTVEPRRRGGQRRRFMCAMQSKTYFRDVQRGGRAGPV